MNVIAIYEKNILIPVENFFTHKKSDIAVYFYFKHPDNQTHIFIKLIGLASNSSNSLLSLPSSSLSYVANKNGLNGYIGTVEVGHPLQVKNSTERYNLYIFYRVNQPMGVPIHLITIPIIWNVQTLDFNKPTYFWIIFLGVILSRLFSFSKNEKDFQISLRPLDLLWVPFSAIITLLIFASFKDQVILTTDLMTNLALAFGFGFGFDKVFETWQKAPKSASAEPKGETALTINTVAPADTSNNIPISSNITATFSEPVRNSSINNKTFTVMDAKSNPITGTVTLTPDGLTTTFMPLSPGLVHNTKHTATITTGVIDRTGNPMLADKKWSFTTAPQPPLPSPRSTATSMNDKVQSPLKGVHPQQPSKKQAEQAVVSGVGSYPNFMYHGGPVINNPQVYMLFVGDWRSEASQSRAGRLRQFVTELFSSGYMNMLSQYGCGTRGAVIESVFVENSNKNLSGSNLNNILQAAIDKDEIPEPTNPSNVHILFLDDATAVKDQEAGAVMCEKNSDNAFGFHEFFRTTAGNVCVFAVVPGLIDACLTGACSNDSECSLHLVQSQEQRQTQVTSHELAEMISDPRLNAWTGPMGENGDICNGESGTITIGPNTWTVQFIYSKWHDMSTNGTTTCIIETQNPLPSLLPTRT
jgi:hypothetical protein